MFTIDKWISLVNASDDPDVIWGTTEERDEALVAHGLVTWDDLAEIGHRPAAEKRPFTISTESDW